ncbi:hypothetical protein ElyMa_006498500 [Elysia marginata]|uniref:Uncharacterized protein n=1 Tax=Elysia marginata TaxID=1093978 RepID=A0AAV4I4P2_9GAST|nr:hypothetical protein ElyMa_006498500 [Elysia marginata]
MVRAIIAQTVPEDEQITPCSCAHNSPHCLGIKPDTSDRLRAERITGHRKTSTGSPSHQRGHRVQAVRLVLTDRPTVTLLDRYAEHDGVVVLL